MSACRRFEQEGLLQLELGEEVDEHFATCPDCRAQKAAYADLTRRLEALGAEDAPPAGWQDEVRRRIARAPAAEAKPRSRYRWAGAALAAAAVVALAILIPPVGGPADLTLRSTVERGDATFRGAEAAQPGDSLRLAATSDPTQYLELRVYRNERQLVARCVAAPRASPSGQAPCRQQDDTASLELLLDAVGRYQPVLLAAAEPLPTPIGDLDADCGAVLTAGGKIELGDEIIVR
ncbi:MAG: hypothetical protein AAF657_24550 [Acidobacteriota bacterium]